MRLRFQGAPILTLTRLFRLCFGQTFREMLTKSRKVRDQPFTLRFQLLVVNSIGTLLAQRLQRSAPGDDLIEHGEVIAPSFLTMTSFVPPNLLPSKRSARTGRLPSSSIRSIERPVHVANPCLIVSLIVS